MRKQPVKPVGRSRGSAGKPKPKPRQYGFGDEANLNPTPRSVGLTRTPTAAGRPKGSGGVSKKPRQSHTSSAPTAPSTGRAVAAGKGRMPAATGLRSGRKMGPLSTSPKGVTSRPGKPASIIVPGKHGIDMGRLQPPPGFPTAGKKPTVQPRKRSLGSAGKY